jgi:hypothetical protein
MYRVTRFVALWTCGDASLNCTAALPPLVAKPLTCAVNVPASTTSFRRLATWLPLLS